MSKLYGELNSDARKTLATARGHKVITAHLRGWDEGVRVGVFINENGTVGVEVWRTGGSNGSRPDKLITSWTEGE